MTDVALAARVAALISDAVYGAGWDGVTDAAPSKNAVYDKIQAVIASIPGAFTPPVAANFSWVNQNNAVATDVTGANGKPSGLVLSCQAQSSSQKRSLFALTASPPSTPYSVYAYISPAFAAQTDWTGVGIFVRNTSSGKLWEISMGANSAGAWTVGGLNVYSWSSITSGTGRNSAPVDGAKAYTTGFWLRIENDGTNLNFYISSSGLEWLKYYTTTLAGYISSVDQVGLLLNNHNGTYPLAAGVLHWYVGA